MIKLFQKDKYLQAEHTCLKRVKIKAVPVYALHTARHSPNAPNCIGRTPIHAAARYGHTEIVKILAPLTEDPNAPDNEGNTPAKIAKKEEIKEFLKTFQSKKIA